MPSSLPDLRQSAVALEISDIDSSPAVTSLKGTLNNLNLDALLILRRGI